MDTFLNIMTSKPELVAYPIMIIAFALMFLGVFKKWF